MKNTIRIVSVIISAIMLLSLCACGNSKAESKDKTTAKFTVVFADKSTKEYTLISGEKTLGAALKEAKIISEKEAAAGFVTYVAGTRADYNKDGAWWCLKDKENKDSLKGINDIKLSEADGYSFVYTKA